MSVSPSRAGASAAVAVVLFAVAGCGGPSPDTHGRPSQPPSRSGSPASPAASRPLTACGSSATGRGPTLPDPDAPAYAGAGPHRAVVGEYIGRDAVGMVHITPSTFSLPDGWQARNPQGTGQDPARAELIVCIAQVAGNGPHPLGSCEYDTGRADVYPARYTVDVYTARTGRRVRRLTMGGDEPAGRSCPPTVPSPAKGFRVAQGISDSAFTARLRPLVQGRAR